jgi:O-antigen chain-terminating methyltransferase
MQSTSLTLLDVLDGVSPDYAVIAQKAAAADVFHRIDSAFEHEYGLNLATLAARYNTQAETKVQHALEQAQQAEVKAQHAWVQTEELHHALHVVVNSRSWRITAPLRWCRLQSSLLHQQGFLVRTKALIKKIASPFVRRFIVFIEARPTLRNQSVVLAQRLGLHQSLRAFYWRFSGQSSPMLGASGHFAIPTQPKELTQRALEIYSGLKIAIKNKQDFR